MEKLGEIAEEIIERGLTKPRVAYLHSLVGLKYALDAQHRAAELALEAQHRVSGGNDGGHGGNNQSPAGTD